MSLVDALRNNREEMQRTRRVNGVATGIVTDNQDPDGYGRVKVRFPWLEEEAESDWTKVMSFMGGKERGAVFLPEVEDEVLVAFEQGDVNHPYVIGGLWSKEDVPPETNADGKNNIRKITSRSGHEIIFNDDDQGQQETLEIHSKSGHSILLDDSTGQEQVVIKDKTGNNIVKIDSVQNTISVSSAMKVTVEAPSIEVKADATLTLQSPMIDIKADAVLTLQGGLVKIN